METSKRKRRKSPQRGLSNEMSREIARGRDRRTHFHIHIHTHTRACTYAEATNRNYFVGSYFSQFWVIIQRPDDQPTGRSADQPTNRPADRLTNRPADRLTGRTTDWPANPSTMIKTYSGGRLSIYATFLYFHVYHMSLCTLYRCAKERQMVMSVTL